MASAATTGSQCFRTYEPNRTRYPSRGIDVSHHQGDIDWAKVAADDVSFAYIKATEGGDFRDKRFAHNWTEARKAGIATGAYHFYRFGRSATEQAQNISATVPKAVGALPIAIDIEFEGNCSTVPDRHRLRSEIALLLRLVEAYYGQESILYVTPELHGAFGAALPARRLWYRSIFQKPRIKHPWAIWQYHNRGSVDGILPLVDLNVLAGSDLAVLRSS